MLEGGLAAASVLISFGVIIGKLNPFQLLVMGILETILYVINMHIGYVIFGAVDVGASHYRIYQNTYLLGGFTILQKCEFVKVQLIHGTYHKSKHGEGN